MLAAYLVVVCCFCRDYGALRVGGCHCFENKMAAGVGGCDLCRGKNGVQE